MTIDPGGFELAVLDVKQLRELEGEYTQLMATVLCPGVATNDRQWLKALKRENRELKRANEVLRKASPCFC